MTIGTAAFSPAFQGGAFQRTGFQVEPADQDFITPIVREAAGTGIKARIITKSKPTLRAAGLLFKSRQRS